MKVPLRRVCAVKDTAITTDKPTPVLPSPQSLVPGPDLSNNTAAPMDDLTSSDLLTCSAADLLRLYRSKRASPVEATRAVLQRIDTLNPVLNAFCFVAPDALAIA